jgi:hypothetical protein
MMEERCDDGSTVLHMSSGLGTEDLRFSWSE